MGNASSTNMHRWLHCEDVLRLILAEIPRPDLKSASLISRDFAVVARGLILQRFVLDISDENKCKRRLDTLRSSPHISERVTELAIVGELTQKSWYHHLKELDDGSPAELERVESLEELQRIIQGGILKAGLQKVRWDAGLDIPATLINAIQVAFPECRFILEKYAGSVLPAMPNLISLAATVRISGDPLFNIQPILRHSPRLHSLRITAYNRSGCVVRVVTLEDTEDEVHTKPFLTYDPTQPVCEMEIGPRIEKLVLEGFTCSDAGAVKSLESISWSRLRKLELTRCNAIPLLRTWVPVGTSLPSLAEFKFVVWLESHDEQTRASATTQALQDFLSSASGLQALHIEGPHHPLVSTIATHHGATLRSLVLHDHERADEPQRTPLNPRDLRRLGENCVSLHHLGVDVNADYTVTQDADSEASTDTLTTILNSTNCFPALRKLTLYAPLGLTQPFTSSGSQALALNARLNVLKDHVAFTMIPDIGDATVPHTPSPGKLHTIVVNIGERDRSMGVGYFAGWRSWEQNNRARMTLERVIPSRRKSMVKVSWTGGYSLHFSQDGEPIAWSIARGNKWVETEWSKPHKGMSRLWKIR